MKIERKDLILYTLKEQRDCFFEGILLTSISNITHAHKLQLMSWCVCCCLNVLELTSIWSYLAICRCFLLSTTRVTSSSPIRRILRMANTEITTMLGFISVTVHTNKSSWLFRSEELTVPHLHPCMLIVIFMYCSAWSFPKRKIYHYR